MEQRRKRDSNIRLVLYSFCLNTIVLSWLVLKGCHGKIKFLVLGGAVNSVFQIPMASTFRNVLVPK